MLFILPKKADHHTDDGREAFSAGKTRPILVSNALVRLITSSLLKTLMHWRQPHSIRQDSQKPRSLRREIGLTLWDGSSFATRLEHRYRQWRTGHAPQIAELVAQARSING